MQFKLRKASDIFMKDQKEVHICTLEQLQELSQRYGHELIIDFDLGTIVVYDSFIE